MLLPVCPGLNFWYYLAIISSPSWLFSFLAMDFMKKTTGLPSFFLISTLLLSWSAANFALSKSYFWLRRNPQTDRFFRGYESAGKTIGYAVLFFGNVGLYFLSEKSVACLLTFLTLALYCLCTFFCIQPYTDFGALEFLLGASLNQSLSFLGIRSGYTWLVIIVCIIIAGIRYRLEPMHSPGEATSLEDQLESGLLLPMTLEPVLQSPGEATSHEDQNKSGILPPLRLRTIWNRIPEVRRYDSEENLVERYDSEGNLTERYDSEGNLTYIRQDTSKAKRHHFKKKNPSEVNFFGRQNIPRPSRGPGKKRF